MDKKLWAAIIVAAALSGCATPYEPSGLMGGFDEVRVSANSYRISVQGNGYTSSERAEQIMMLRAAELTLQNGYTHYAIQGRETATDKELIYTGVYTGYTNISRPRGAYIITMLKGPDIPPGAFDARLIESELRNKLTQPKQSVAAAQ